MKKLVLFLICMIALTSLVSAYSLFPRPNLNNTFFPNQYFVFNFTFLDSSASSLFSNQSNLTTDSSGVAFTDLTLPTFSSVPTRFLHYRDGSLIVNKSFDNKIFNKIYVNSSLFNIINVTGLYANGINLSNINNDFYNRSQVDNNFSLYTPGSHTTDTWLLNFTNYYDKSQVDNNLSNYWKANDGSESRNFTGGNLSVDEFLLTLGSNTDYKFVKGTLSPAEVVLQNQLSGDVGRFALMTTDNDGTDTNLFRVYGNGSENIALGYLSTGNYLLSSFTKPITISGTPITLSGSVTINSDLTLDGDLVFTDGGQLDFDGSPADFVNSDLNGFIFDANINTTGNVTANTFVGDGSKLTGISGDNSSWNESYANSLYIKNDTNVQFLKGSFSKKLTITGTDDSYGRLISITKNNYNLGTATQTQFVMDLTARTGTGDTYGAKRLSGASFIVQPRGNADSDQTVAIAAFDSRVEISGAGTLTGGAYGANNLIISSGSGNVSTAIGGRGTMVNQGTGTFTNARVFESNGYVNNAGATIDKFTGFYAKDPAEYSGTINTYYGIYIEEPSAPTTNYAGYIEGGTWAFDDDNSKTIWGEGQDASIYYNSSDMIINPKEVGSGKVYINGGITGNYSVGNCWIDFKGGIAYETNCTAY